MPVFYLSKDIIFPPTHLAEKDGLLAIGGDLSTERLLLAYQQGIFPWYSSDEPILWYCPRKRFVIFPSEYKVSSSLLKLYKKGVYKYSINGDFESVIQMCSGIKRKNQDGTWITDEMIQAYIQIHEAGYALSVEVWNAENELVGGLYGVKIDDFFAGESMFSSESNTSKLALYHLIQSTEIKMIDCQMHTTHLESLGARHILYKNYVNQLKKLIKK
jgi:leucyl/phenylalanyl-tRNA--protein transferase